MTMYIFINLDIKKNKEVGLLLAVNDDLRNLEKLTRDGIEEHTQSLTRNWVVSRKHRRKMSACMAPVQGGSQPPFFPGMCHG